MKLSIISFLPASLAAKGGLIVSIPLFPDSIPDYIESANSEGWDIENCMNAIVDDIVREKFPGIDLPSHVLDEGFPWDGEGEAILVTLNDAGINASRVIYVDYRDPWYPSGGWLDFVKEIAY